MTKESIQWINSPTNQRSLTVSWLESSKRVSIISVQPVSYWWLEGRSSILLQLVLPRHIPAKVSWTSTGNIRAWRQEKMTLKNNLSSGLSLFLLLGCSIYALYLYVLYLYMVESSYVLGQAGSLGICIFGGRTKLKPMTSGSETIGLGFGSHISDQSAAWNKSAYMNEYRYFHTNCQSTPKCDQLFLHVHGVGTCPSIIDVYCIVQVMSRNWIYLRLFFEGMFHCFFLTCWSFCCPCKMEDIHSSWSSYFPPSNL